MEDAYRFPPILTDLDLHLLGEGTHLELYDKLGAHPMQHDGVDGVAFVVFAPNARRVSVVGDFNFWDGRRHAMRVRGNGYWEIFVPGARAGDKYKYEIVGAERATAAAQGRPGRVRGRAAALDRVDRGRCRAPAAAGAAGAQRQCTIGADVDLRGASRLMAAKARAKAAAGSPTASWPSSFRPMPPTWASPTSS